jgi:YHS domain-containing protein
MPAEANMPNFENDPSRIVAKKNWANRPSPAAIHSTGISVTDPVCNTTLVSSNFKSEYDGRAFVFCSEDCKTKFDAEPTSYV